MLSIILEKTRGNVEGESKNTEQPATGCAHQLRDTLLLYTACDATNTDITIPTVLLSAANDLANVESPYSADCVWVHNKITNNNAREGAVHAESGSDVQSKLCKLRDSLQASTMLQACVNVSMSCD